MTLRPGHPGPALIAALLLATLLAACGGSATPEQGPAARKMPTTQAVGVPMTASDGRGAIRPLPPPQGCTKTADTAASARESLRSTNPGDKICILGDLGNYRLLVGYAGSPTRPVTVVGDGNTRLTGIDVETDNIVVQGFTVLNGKGPEVKLLGNNINFSNNVVRNAISGSSDSVQFFGSDISITHNTLGEDTQNPAATPNCLETHPNPSADIVTNHVSIRLNRCENTANACLQASGPAPGPTPSPQVQNITFADNYCQAYGPAGVSADNVPGMVITGNEAWGPRHAWSFRNGSTGARVAGNRIAENVAYEVGMDPSSQAGYDGPPAGGGP